MVRSERRITTRWNCVDEKGRRGKRGEDQTQTTSIANTCEVDFCTLGLR